MGPPEFLILRLMRCDMFIQKSSKNFSQDLYGLKNDFSMEIMNSDVFDCHGSCMGFPWFLHTNQVQWFLHRMESWMQQYRCVTVFDYYISLHACVTASRI